MPGTEPQVVGVDSRDMWILGIAGMMMLATVVLLVVAITLLGSNQRTLIHNQHQLLHEAKVAAVDHRANCEFRGSLREQVKTSTAYLAAHPEGAPALHISAASIRSTIARQKAAADSLAGLDCGPA